MPCHATAADDAADFLIFLARFFAAFFIDISSLLLPLSPLPLSLPIFRC